MIGNREKGVRGRERKLGRGAVIHLKGGDKTERLVSDAVISETDPLRETRPVEIVGGGQKTHGAIPESPP